MELDEILRRLKEIDRRLEELGASGDNWIPEDDIVQEVYGPAPFRRKPDDGFRPERNDNPRLYGPPPER